ncbi:MFS-type transporter SLC18B1-like [Pollicipes pollicipes]|uniref:MFS-type transporter SLC18B1-like n=1 Tax=Pollicipes pollicipes TaxID=41117 RepID=UPI0018853A18|nr:MFS-type transporter SLC18B1-like [Pollicipes pollicipes]
MYSVAYGVASPISGRLSDVINNRLLLIGCALVLTSPVLICFSPPTLLAFIPSDRLWLALLCLCLAAALIAATMVPTFGVLRDMLKGPVGLPDDVTTDALVSSAFQTFFYVGYVVGPAVGGLLVDSMGFSNSVVVISGVVLFWGVLSLITGSVLACQRPSPAPRTPLGEEAAAKRRPENLDLSRLSIRDSGGYKSFLPEVGSLTEADPEYRIAEMIKNADLRELQELLKSPLDTPPLPW